MDRTLFFLLSAPVLVQASALPDAPTADPAFIKARVEALYQEGLTLYQAGQFREALPKFEAAQALFPDPSLIYNIARCHEGLGELEIAEARYERLLADPEAPAEVKVKGEARLAALRAQRAPLAPPLVAPPPVAVVEDDSLAPWLVIGTGGVAIAGGVVFITLGVADHEELDRSQQGPGRELPREKAKQLDEDGATKKTAGGALLGLGATAVGVGAYLLLTDNDAAVAPVAGLGSLGLTGRF